MGENATTRSSDPAHAPFRSWALQHDILSLLGGSVEWRDASGEFGEDVTPIGSEQALRGQGHLRSALATNPRLELRTRTTAVLWAAGMLTIALNQLLPLAISIPTSSFWPLILALLVCCIGSLVISPRLTAGQYFALEQAMMLVATLIVFFLCAHTRGTASPYVFWFILTAYYSAYLMPPVQGALNLVWVTALCLLTLTLDATELSSFVFLQLAALLATIWVVSSALIQQRRREDTLERAISFTALADPLTSTANMRSFEEYVDELLRRDGQRVALLVADMNGLKAANTGFGHEAGDDMLIRTARLMQRASGERDQVARFGGDEFAVVIPDGREEDAARWRSEFEELVDRHNRAVRGRLPQISVAIGSALYPDDGMRVDELIDVADRRMFKEKLPNVANQYELDTLSPADAARGFQTTQLQSAPDRAVDVRDRLRQGAVNWIAFGALGLAAAAISGPYTHLVLAVASSICALLLGLLTVYLRRHRLSRGMSSMLDLATLAFPLPIIWSTGGSSSALLVALAMPVTFYAQNFRLELALPRIAILVAGVLAGYSLGGAHSELELTYLIVIIVAMTVIVFVMQHSTRLLSESLLLLRNSSRIDRLTGLRNAIALRGDLEQAVRDAERSEGQSEMGLVILDLDGFRRANTIAGHRGGDEVLAEIARRLLQSAGDAHVYRIGGDEFVVLHLGMASNELADAAARAAAAIEYDHQFDASSLPVSATAGHARWREGSTPDLLIEEAETMLRDSKHSRRTDERGKGRQLL